VGFYIFRGMLLWSLILISEETCRFTSYERGWMDDVVVKKENWDFD